MVRTMVKLRRGSIGVAASLWLCAAAAVAQPTPGDPDASPRLQSAVEALAQDAGEYARQYDVSLDEAMHRLRAQEESVAATDRLRETYKDRLAGISIEHSPEYRIVVLLTGDEPVADEQVIAGDRPVPILFRTGAAATEAQIAEAIAAHQAEIRATFRHAGGLGADTRTGALVVMVKAFEIFGRDLPAEERRLAEIAGVPVRILPIGQTDANLSIDGGARIVGINPADGQRYACTTGFVVDGAEGTGVVTAAHCPDAVTYYSPDGHATPLSFVGQWGARYQDVQVHLSTEALRPIFYADSDKSAARAVTGWRNRASTRIGDFVCHRGERSGYSCAEVMLTDYAPPAPLCAGPCDPVWVAVAGPSCKSGDSGGPVFSRGIAFGILKGASYNRSGGCDLYFYMSTDYLPEGWSLAYDTAQR
jgi:streptogrisin C